MRNLLQRPWRFNELKKSLDGISQKVLTDSLRALEEDGLITRTVFRLFSSDIGLLTSAYPAETKIELINKNGEVNNGAHFENYIAQQLTRNGFEPYFCKKKNIGEMDFAIEMNGKVIPIEVKSGKSYKLHKALDNFMNVQDYHLEKAYVFSIGNVEKEGNVVYLPIYMCYLLKEQRIGQMIVELDITGL